jgi:hypothetical protein
MEEFECGNRAVLTDVEIIEVVVPGSACDSGRIERRVKAAFEGGNLGASWSCDPYDNYYHPDLCHSRPVVGEEYCVSYRLKKQYWKRRGWDPERVEEEK